MLRASNASPIKWGIYAIEGATWRDFTLAEMMPALGILVGIGAVAFALGAAILTRAGRRAG